MLKLDIPMQSLNRQPEMAKKPTSPTENLPVPDELIKRWIYLIRAEKVMLKRLI